GGVGARRRKVRPVPGRERSRRPIAVRARERQNRTGAGAALFRHPAGDAAPLRRNRRQDRRSDLSHFIPSRDSGEDESYFLCSRSQRSAPGCSGTSIGVESVSVTEWTALPPAIFSQGISASRAATAAQMS